MAKKDNSRKNILYSSVNKDKEELNVKELGKVPKVGYRHLQCLLYFFLIMIGYVGRVILSVAIVAMTDPRASSNPDIPTYPEWTRKGAILSAFFWGYICPQIFAGYAAKRFGAKWFMVATMGIQSTLSVFIPLIACHFGDIGLMVTRAAQGFCQGFFFPTVVHLLSQWAPQEERATLNNYAFASVPLGTVIALYITGIISASRFGWPMVFYLVGGSGLLWCVCFSVLGYDSPAKHPKIGDAEKYYIESSLGHVDEKSSQTVPWKSIFSSIHVWALLLAQCGGMFGFWILLTQIPSYMSYVMNFNIKENSTLSSLPYSVMFLIGFILSPLSDYIVNKGFISRTNSRKMFNTLGSVSPAVALIMLAYTNSDEPSKAVVLLTLAVVGGNFSMVVGWGVNYIDLSPNYAGTLMGLCGGASNILSILAPLIVQFLVTDQTDPEQWKIIFFLAAGCYLATGLFYLIFGSGESQPWNKNREDEVEEHE